MHSEQNALRELTRPFLSPAPKKKERIGSGYARLVFSVLVVKSRISPPKSSCIIPQSFRHLSITNFLPSESDVASIRLNLAIIVSRILCTYIKDLRKFKKLIPQHIMHRHSLEMATKSEVAVLDVLYKNEACHQDMLDIMRSQRTYLGKISAVLSHQVVIYLHVKGKEVHSNM